MSVKFKLLCSALSGLLACMLCLLYGRQIEANAEDARSELLERYGGEIISIVVATRDLAAGDVIDSTNAQVREWLVDLAPEEPLYSLEEIVGYELTSAVGAGTALSQANFEADSESLPIPSGCVSFSISVTDKLSLPSSVQKGSVLVAYEVLPAAVRVISNEVHILSMSWDSTALSSKGTVTVAVPAADASAVFSAKDEGTLRLAFVADDVDSSLSVEESQQAPSQVLPTEDDERADEAAEDETAAAEADAGAGSEEDGDEEGEAEPENSGTDSQHTGTEETNRQSQEEDLGGGA